MTIRDIVKGHSYFTLHFETITAQVKKQMELPVHYWSEVDNRAKIKYLISIVFGHAKVPDVVTDTQVIREISDSSQTYALSSNGWNKCKQIYTEQNK